MTKLSDKDRRKLLNAAKRLFSIKSLLVPRSINDFREIPAKQHFSRMLTLAGNKTVFLTDSGYEHFRTIVAVIDRADIFGGMADFSDIWTAWHKVVKTWFSNGLEPENVDEVVQAITEIVAQEIDDHTFIVPLFGIELDSVDSFALGRMAILRMSVDVLEASGIEHNHANVPHLLELNKNYLWLKGTARGTPRVAQQKFSDQATLTVGILAISAASMYELGACGFRIGTIMSSEDATGRSTWFSWSERVRSLTTHYASPKGQRFPVNKALGDESDMARIIYCAITILQKEHDRTELEEAIARAVYWYSDAQRDSVLVMRLVKYWSCVEAFFSFKNEEITQAVSSGLASTLVFGGFQFVTTSEYSTLKRRIANLYSLRSRAVHRGSHQHTTELDVAQFSQWVAWMIISMVALVEQGYTTLNEVKMQTDRLDSLAIIQCKKAV
ncbi:MAG: HEPN domain-containing protein [Gallionellaceae bacterium]|nr:HEPN domain-containing protein [Gallionellaceae bacterium]